MAEHTNHTDGDEMREPSEVLESKLENYTGSELPYWALYMSGIALAVTAVVFAVALIPLRDAFISNADKRTEGLVLPVNERPTASTLQPSPEGDWRVFESLMHERMTTFGYNDKANGLVHIPADRAIELAISENLIRSTPDAVPAAFNDNSAGHDSGHGDEAHGSDEATDDHGDDDGESAADEGEASH